MQLQELKMLVEYEAVGSLIATNIKGGWVLTVTRKKISKGGDKISLLDLARGGTRMFKTLDALAKLVKVELYSSPFTVC